MQTTIFCARSRTVQQQLLKSLPAHLTRENRTAFHHSPRNHKDSRQRSLSLLKDLLEDHSSDHSKLPQAQTTRSIRGKQSEIITDLQAKLQKYRLEQNRVNPPTPAQRWRRFQQKPHLLGSLRGHGATGAASEVSSTINRSRSKIQEPVFDSRHLEFLNAPFNSPSPRDRPQKMRSFVQVLTTPTVDTPGTTLLLHFDNKRYMIGSLAEGTQRACVQTGTKLLKVSEYFLTGRSEWRNTGGLIGMILTLADVSASSHASSIEEALRKARGRAEKLGWDQDPVKMREVEENVKKTHNNTLSIFGPPNLNHTLATARRYVFRKGMPVNIHEIRDARSAQRHLNADEDWEPSWSDENIKVWTMSILPSGVGVEEGRSFPRSISPRKRSFAEVDAEIQPGKEGPAVMNASLSEDEQDYLTVKAVVGEMFNSSWRLDALFETPLAEVKLPATIFVRDPDTKKLERYHGPLPGRDELPDPQKPVLVRRPWPGALVDSLPKARPAHEAVSYIIRNHTQRGKFDPKRAVVLKIKQKSDYAKLAAGDSVVNEDGETITSEMVLGKSKEGGGIVVLDLPSEGYIDNALSRPEWRESKVMAGVGAVFWVCGTGVASDARVRAFMQDFQQLEHIVSSPDYCPNGIALDSAATASVRLRQVDPDRFSVPVHDCETRLNSQDYGGSSAFQDNRNERPLPPGVHIAARGQTVQLEPAIVVNADQSPPPLDIDAAAQSLTEDVLEEAHKAQSAAKSVDQESLAWIDSLPSNAGDAEIITLGTGSALPSKYRNVSATLLRVPGWGNVLFDAGENTLGQLKRVFTAAEMKQELRDLRMILISHMHADHQLGTTSVIKAWYEEVHSSQSDPSALAPLSGSQSPNTDTSALLKAYPHLAVISEPAMQHWLYEYSQVEDYGYSRIAPLHLSAANVAKRHPSKISWFAHPSSLADLHGTARTERATAHTVSPASLNLTDLQAVHVQHCHGARAVSLTFPSGLKVSYSGDCRPSNDFAAIGKGSTVCIHEATFDDELVGDAIAKNHSTTSEALRIAQKMHAKACLLTHFSQRYQKVPVLERAAEDEPQPENTPFAFPTTDGPDVEEGAEEDPDATLIPNDPIEQTAPPATNPSTDPTPSSTATQGPVRLKVASDMKVCVAFDYMRVRVRDIALMEKYTPALLALFADDEKEPILEIGAERNGNGSAKGKKKNGKKGKEKYAE